MFKVKRVRTIDAVVVGWRPGKEPDTVGALILGLYDGDAAARRRSLLGPERRREAPPGRLPRAVRDGRARLRRAEPLERRAGAGVGRAAPRARRRDRLRPCLRRAHPPRRQAASLARGQAARASARDRAAARLSSSSISVSEAPSDGDSRRGGVPADPVLAAGGRPADDRRERRPRDAALGADRPRDGRAPRARRLHHPRRTARSRSPTAAPSTPRGSSAATA